MLGVRPAAGAHADARRDPSAARRGAPAARRAAAVPPHAAEQGRRALPRRLALVRELARRRSRSRRVHGELQGVRQALPAEQRGELERLRAVPAPRARRCASASGRVVREPAHDGAVRRPRAVRRRGAEHRCAAPLALPDRARRRPHEHPRAASAAFAGSATRLDSRSRPAELHELRIKSETIALRARVLRRRVSARCKQPAKDCKALQDLLGTHQDVVYGHRASAPLRQPAEEARRSASALPAALVAAAPQPAPARARACAARSREQWPAFVARRSTPRGTLVA